MPATQHDALLWLAGAAYDVVFDEARAAIAALTALADVAEETSSWPYRPRPRPDRLHRRHREPERGPGAEVALVPRSAPVAARSVLLLQRWAHDVKAWEAQSTRAQEAAMGRTKNSSTELDDTPKSSHVARTDQDDFGHIFRRNMPYGTVTAHGTMFVGFAADQRPLARMLESMAGLAGPRDELTQCTTPETGGYYFVPAVSALRAFATGADEN
jgi:porphyrinogen peroxidase